jgi:ABC-type sulfate transport system permease subunit
VASVLTLVAILTLVAKSKLESKVAAATAAQQEASP